MVQLPMAAQHRRGQNSGERPIPRRERGRPGSVGQICKHLIERPLINEHACNQPVREVARV